MVVMGCDGQPHPTTKRRAVQGIALNEMHGPAYHTLLIREVPGVMTLMQVLHAGPARHARPARLHGADASDARGACSTSTTSHHKPAGIE